MTRDQGGRYTRPIDQRAPSLVQVIAGTLTTIALIAGAVAGGLAAADRTAPAPEPRTVVFTYP